jgi:hypothetical protein
MLIWPISRASILVNSRNAEGSGSGGNEGGGGGVLQPRLRKSIQPEIAKKDFFILRLSAFSNTSLIPVFPCHHDQPKEKLVRRAFSLLKRSKARTMSLSISSVQETPEASHGLGYMLILVKPGMVFISFTISIISDKNEKKMLTNLAGYVLIL